MTKTQIEISSFPHLKSFNTYIDIGACYGETSIPFIGKFERIICFEPNPDTFSKLPKEFENYNIAFGDEEKIVSLILPNGKHKPQHGSISRFGENGSWSKIGDKMVDPKREYIIDNVQVKKLDDYNFENVDLIKIDTEGYEINVCRGSVETIKKYKPVIYFETKQPDQFPTKQFLSDLNLGYEFEVCRGNNTLAYLP